MEHLEQWKSILEFHNLYEVSNLGNVRSIRGHSNCDRIKLLKQHKVGGGNRPVYYQVYLYDRKGNRKSIKVHRLVAQAFIKNPNRLPCINHKDENTLNNCVDNLEWCTKQYNNTYGNAIAKANAKRVKPVYFYKDNSLVLEFPSVIKAGEHFNVKPQNIARAARGVRQSFHGFKVTYNKP